MGRQKATNTRQLFEYDQMFAKVCQYEQSTPNIEHTTAHGDKSLHGEHAALHGDKSLHAGNTAAKSVSNIALLGGVDEAGRGPLAGPVVVACCILTEFIDGIDDSKKLSEKKRIELYDKIVQSAIEYKVSIIEPKTIDYINILQATKLGMKSCIDQMQTSMEFVLVDGNPLDIGHDNTIFVTKGDATSYCIAAASIIAKVTRDNIMIAMHNEYPEYGFDKHKGYGTKAHYDAMQKHGITRHHRKSFLKNLNIE